MTAEFDVGPEQGRMGGPAEVRRAAIVERLRTAGSVFAEDEADLLLSSAMSEPELRTMVARRAAGEPIAHIVGWAWFHGRRHAVTRGVFIPRRRSEFLVDVAVGLVPPGGVVVDLCCGSGAVGVAVVATVDADPPSPEPEPELEYRSEVTPGNGPEASIQRENGAAHRTRLVACDVDPVAVRCARRNVALVGGTAVAGDLYDALPGDLIGRVDVAVVNAPYVPSDHVAMMPSDIRAHEPRSALDGGPDGLGLHPRIAAEAPRWLAPDGALVVEVGAGQASAMARLLAAAGLTTSVATSDELEATVVVGTRSALTSS